MFISCTECPLSLPTTSRAAWRISGFEMNVLSWPHMSLIWPIPFPSIMPQELLGLLPLGAPFLSTSPHHSLSALYLTLHILINCVNREIDQIMRCTVHCQNVKAFILVRSASPMFCLGVVYLMACLSGGAGGNWTGTGLNGMVSLSGLVPWSTTLAQVQLLFSSSIPSQVIIFVQPNSTSCPRCRSRRFLCTWCPGGASMLACQVPVIAGQPQGPNLFYSTPT
jgi:hypothetical protein